MASKAYMSKLTADLKGVKRGDVIYYRDDNERIHTCLVYGVDMKGITIASPDVRKHREAFDPNRLTQLVKWGIPVFADFDFD